MSRLKEQRLWDSFKTYAVAEGKTFFWLQRVENMVGEGIPDVYCSALNGAECWVELKAPIRPKRATTRLLGDQGLRFSQINWHLKAAQFNVRSFVLIRDDHSNLYLLDGRHAKSMNEWSCSQVELYSLTANKSWPSIFEILANHEIYLHN